MATAYNTTSNSHPHLMKCSSCEAAWSQDHFCKSGNSKPTLNTCARCRVKRRLRYMQSRLEYEEKLGPPDYRPLHSPTSSPPPLRIPFSLLLPNAAPRLPSPYKSPYPPLASGPFTPEWRDRALIAEIDHDIHKTRKLRNLLRLHIEPSYPSTTTILQKQRDRAERDAQLSQRLIEIHRELDEQNAKKKHREDDDKARRLQEQLRWAGLSKAQRRQELRDYEEKKRLQREQRDQQLEEQRRRLKEDLKASTWEEYQQRRARYEERGVVEVERQSAERWRYGRWESYQGIRFITWRTNELLERLSATRAHRPRRRRPALRRADTT